MKKDLTVTILNSIGIVIGVIFTNAYISRQYGIETLGEYLLIRRTIYSIMPILIFGMHDGIAYYVAKNHSNRFGDYGLFLFIFITVPLITVVSTFIYLGFIPGINPNLCLAILWYTLGVTAHNHVFGLYRGKFQMIAGNFIQLIGAAIFPFIVVVLYSNLQTILLYTGISVFSVSIVSYLIINRCVSFKKINWHELIRLFKYGLERLPSFISQAVLLVSIPLLIASEINFEEIAYFNTSLSLIRSFFIVIGPIGLILIPVISRALEKGNKELVSQQIGYLVRITLIVSVYSTVILFYYGGTLIEFWLGEISASGVLIVKGLVITIPFYAVVGVIRSPIDAANDRGYNSIIFTVSASIMLILFFILKLINIPIILAGIVSIVTGYFCACVIGLYFIKKLFQINPLNLILILRTSIFAICLFVLFFIIALFIQTLIIQLFVNIILSIILFILFLKQFTKQSMLFI